jgi:hypothetical protein
MVEGTLMAPDQSGTNQPVRNAKIKIYDEESYYLFGNWVHLPWGDEYIKTVYTNDNGYFATSINNDDGSTILFGDEHGRDIYLVIESENRHAKVTKGPSWRPFKGVFSHQTTTKRERTTGADFSTIVVTGETGTALDILSTVELGWRYMRDNAGMNLPKANVYYKDGIFTPGESYCFPDSIGAIIISPQQIEPLPVWIQPYPVAGLFLSQINELSGLHLQEDNMAGERRYEIIFHEYGHFVMDKIGDLYPPWTELLHDPTTPYSEPHAFQEGFAEFFSAAVREEYGYANPLLLGSSTNIENVGPISPLDRSDEIEFNVAGVLWDIFDDNMETWDDSEIEFNTIINTIIDYDPDPGTEWFLGQDHPWTIYEFFQGYVESHPGDPTISQIWRIMEHYHMDTGVEDTTPPTTPTSYTSSHNPLVATDDDTIEVTLLGVTDDFSGVSSYKYRFTTSPDLEPQIWFYSTSPQITSLQLWDDIWYMIVEITDYAGNTGNRYITGPLIVGKNQFIQLDGAISLLDLTYAGIGTTGEITVTPKPSKLDLWDGPAFQIPGLMESPTTIGTIDFSTLGLLDGPFQLKVMSLYTEPSENEEESFELVFDTTPPDITVMISGPNHSSDPVYVTRDTLLTVTATDQGIGVESIEYRFDDIAWNPYFSPVHPPSVPDGAYTFQARATDYLGNTDTYLTEIVLDNTGPVTTSMSPTPDSVILDEVVFQAEIEDPTGVDTVIYNLRLATDPLTDIGYEAMVSEKIDGYWSLTLNTELLDDDLYDVIVEARDLLGNIQLTSYQFQVDNNGPTIVLESPSPGSALQNTVHLKVEAVDPSGVQEVHLTIRSGTTPNTPMGYEEIDLDYNPASMRWERTLNTVPLDDGSYNFVLCAVDQVGNTNIETIQFTVRNGEIATLLPKSENYRAGRTVPIKFTLNIDPDVDLDTPFVYNEELVIKIISNGVLVHESKYGETSQDYRIEAPVHYITNFKTDKKPKEYAVEILNQGIVISSFTIQTTRK